MGDGFLVMLQVISIVSLVLKKEGVELVNLVYAAAAAFLTDSMTWSTSRTGLMSNSTYRARARAKG